MLIAETVVKPKPLSDGISRNIEEIVISSEKKKDLLKRLRQVLKIGTS